MICYIIQSGQYVNKAHWNVDAEGWVNANPILLKSGPNAGNYALPEDFFYPIVTDGSHINNALLDRVEALEQNDSVSSDFNDPVPPPVDPPPAPVLPQPVIIPPPVVIVPPPPPPAPIPFVWGIGSLGEHITRAISTRITGKDPTVVRQIYSVQDHYGNHYVRNPNCWASDIDLTGISPWNTSLGQQKAGTLITRRHFIVSAHWGNFGEGKVIRFVSQSGEIFDRTVLKGLQHPLYPLNKSNFPDFGVYVLDADLPGDIKSYKIFPSNVDIYFPPADIIRGLPWIFGTDQQEDLSVAKIWRVEEMGFYYQNTVYPQIPWAFFKPPIAGDSSSGYFAIINNEPVLLYVLTGGGGTRLDKFIADINQLIINLDIFVGVMTGHQIETVDLSGFTI